MNFHETPLQGCFVVDIEPISDNRGFFARAACEQEFAEHGLNGRFTQTNLVWSEARATLRGIHFQGSPHAEAKLVRCFRGRIFDVAVDLREGSPTRLRWFGIELGPTSRTALYVPEGFGHGCISLEADTEFMYQATAAYHRPSASGVRWDDPALAIDWPLKPERISEADLAWPLIQTH